MWEARFGLREHGTNVRRELLAGLTTFLTMAYVAFVNPAILAEAGMDFGAVFVATCLAAALGSLLMGLLANQPIALAPGMGLNAYFTYDVVLSGGHDWRVALGAVFASGLLFVLLSILPVREWILDSIPRTLKLAISGGIGLFLALVGLRNAGIVIDDPASLVALGDLRRPAPLLALLGFVAMFALSERRVRGAVVVSILGVTALGLALGISEWHGLASAPPDLRPTLFQLDLSAALSLALAPVVFTLLFVDLFDTAGTLIGVAHRAGLLDQEGRLPRAGRALLADSTATAVGALLGTSTTTSYIESAAGVEAGGRTGLVPCTVAALFVLCLFLAPLAQTIPAYATAPALVYVACLMARAIGDLDWSDATEYGPGILAALGIPFTGSISDGIGLGFMAYAAIKWASGRGRDCSPAALAIAVLYALRFALL